VHAADARDDGAGAAILAGLGVRQALLLSNSPAERLELERRGIEGTENSESHFPGLRRAPALPASGRVTVPTWT
jgi:GTP cyclohydrolase II